MAYIHILDLIGVFAFAAYGAHKAVVARFDLFGVAVCGAITAFAGGTIRELILNSTPAYLSDYSYVVVAAIGVAFAIAVHSRFAKIERYLLAVDAIGVAVFAYIGAYRADVMHLGLTAMVFFAVLTAAGGGVVSDILSGRRPEAFYKDFYPLAALVLGVGYFIIQPVGQEPAIALTLITLAFAVRLISIQLKVKLWKPYKRPGTKRMKWVAQTEEG